MSHWIGKFVLFPLLLTCLRAYLLTSLSRFPASARACVSVPLFVLLIVSASVAPPNPRFRRFQFFYRLPVPGGIVSYQLICLLTYLLSSLSLLVEPDQNDEVSRDMPVDGHLFYSRLVFSLGGATERWIFKLKTLKDCIRRNYYNNSSSALNSMQFGAEVVKIFATKKEGQCRFFILGHPVEGGALHGCNRCLQLASWLRGVMHETCQPVEPEVTGLTPRLSTWTEFQCKYGQIPIRVTKWMTRWLNWA